MKKTLPSSRLHAITLVIGLLLSSAVPGAGVPIVHAQSAPEVERLLRDRMESLRVGGMATAGDQHLLARMALPAFYEDRAFAPVGTGPGALGNVMFMFPDRHNVYVHDTPTRDLFARARRSFSSGCIRVEDPLELAEYLLADHPDWTRERLDGVVVGGLERSVRFSRAVPVHLVYSTARADEEGIVHFRDDIYGWDRTVRATFTDDPPGP